MAATGTTAMTELEVAKATFLRSLRSGRGLVGWECRSGSSSPDEHVKAWLSIEPVKGSPSEKNLVLRKSKQRRLWKKQRHVSQSLTVEKLRWSQVAAVSRSVVVEGALWILGADHSPQKRRIDILNWRFRLEGSTTLIGMKALVEVLQSGGCFDNAILKNLIPTHGSTMTLETNELVGSVTNSEEGLLGATEDPETQYSVLIDGTAFCFNRNYHGGILKQNFLPALSRLSEIGSKAPMLAPVIQFMAVVVATYENVQGLKSDFIELLKRWDGVEDNLENEESLGWAIHGLAEDFFFKWRIERGLASDDFKANLSRLQGRMNVAMAAKTLDVATSNSNKLDLLINHSDMTEKPVDWTKVESDDNESGSSHRGVVGVATVATATQPEYAEQTHCKKENESRSMLRKPVGMPPDDGKTREQRNLERQLLSQHHASLFELEKGLSLADALRNTHAPRTLYLGNNNIGPDGANEIAGALRVNTTIQQLYLGNNNIGDDGAKEIASALRVNTTLQTLDLNGNKIDAAGAKEIASALRVNTTLKQLYLYDNYIGDDGAEEIASALRVNTTLQTLHLGYNDIGDGGAKEIVSALRVNITAQQQLHRDLTELDGNPEEAAFELFSSLRSGDFEDEAFYTLRREDFEDLRREVLTWVSTLDEWLPA